MKANANLPTARRALPPLCTTALALLFLLPSWARAADCGNEAIRAAQVSSMLPEGTSHFPNCMALEMISPPKKFVQPAFGPLFSASGERVLFKSTAGLGGTPGLQNGLADYYVASRAPGGWGTAATSPPSSASIATGSNLGGPYAFSGEMGSWVLFGSSQDENQVAALRFFQGGIDGSFLPLSELLVPRDDSGRPRLFSSVVESPWKGTSRDLSTTLFSTRFASTTFLPGDPGEGTSGDGEGGDRNEYVVSRDSDGSTSLELLARDKDGTIYGGFCGTHLGGGVGGNQFGPGRVDQGTIAADGSRIYFSTRPDQPGEVAGVWQPCDTENPLRIMVRNETPDGPVIEELIPGEASEPGDFYQGASADGSMVFFTTTRQLVAGDTDTGAKCSADPGQSGGCDLYLYDADLPEGDRLIEVSAGPQADVLSSITAVSNDGSHAYFVAEGVLSADANPEGASAVDGEPNLYLYEAGELTFLGVLGDEDEQMLWGTERSFSGGAYAVPLWDGDEGGDGHILMLASSASLTADDKDGSDRDVFRYDATAATLQCISCSDIEESKGFDVSVNPYEGKLPAPNFTEPGRWVSEDGNTVAFVTEEQLAPGDADGVQNPYVWADGQLARLPTVFKGLPVELPAVSAPGNEVAFFTDSALLSAFDGDTARDVYVLRSGGGFMPPSRPQICDPQLGNCLGPASQAPTAAPIVTAVTGPGNPKAKKKKSNKKKKSKKKKQQNGKRGNRK